MKRVHVADICSINPRLPASLASDKNREVDFVPMANLGEDGRISINGSRKLGEVLKGYTYFENGDVIVAKITPCLENGKAAYVRGLPHGIGFGSTEFHVLRPQEGVESRFLFYMIWTPWFRHEASRNMTGTAGQQRVPANFFERFRIPLPPVSEQKRIADILDKADAIRRKRRQAQDQIRTLKNSLFAHMFGDIPAKKSRYPFTPFREWITAANGRSSRDVLSTENTDIPAFGGNGPTGWATRAMYDVPVIVVGRVGQQCGITRTTRGPAWITDNAIAVQIHDSDKVELAYLAAALERSTLGHDVRYIDLPYINQSMILDLPLPSPPIEQQREFARRQASIERFANQLAVAFNEANDLFNSLVQRAFRGEL